MHINPTLTLQPAIAIAIREQLYEVSQFLFMYIFVPYVTDFVISLYLLMLQIAVQNVTSIRESRINKKGRRGFEHSQARSVLC